MRTEKIASTEFAESNKKANLEIQRIADRIVDGTVTERERNALVSIIYPKLKFYISKFFIDQNHTEEVLHNSIEKIFKSIRLYNNTWKFTTWIYNISKNEALLYRHKLTERHFVDVDTVEYLVNSIDESSSVDEHEMQMQNLHKLTVQAIHSMEDGIEKTILIDKEINLMKGADISAKHNMNLNTVKTKLRKARRQVREFIVKNNPNLIDTINTFA
jgi:RNA polymerase sigma factor (sigma-70 family)